MKFCLTTHSLLELTDESAYVVKRVVVCLVRYLSIAALSKGLLHLLSTSAD